MLFNWGYQKGKKRIKGFPPVHDILPIQSKKEDKHMRAKSLFLGISLIGMIGASVVGGTDVEAKSSACTTVKITKSNISSSKKKAWSLYKKGKPFMLSGKNKYYKKVNKYLTEKVMKENGVKWVPPLSTYNKKEIKAYKTNVKYLGKIVKDIRANYKEQMSNPSYRRYWDYFTKKESESQKVYASITSRWLYDHIDYIRENRYSNIDYKKLYTKTYKSACNGDTKVGVGIIKALGFKARKKYYYDDNHVVPQIGVTIKGKLRYYSVYGDGGTDHLGVVFDFQWDWSDADITEKIDRARLTEDEFNAKYNPTTPDTSVPTVTEEEKKADEDAKKWQDDISNVNPDDLVIDMGDYFAKTDK